MANKVTAEEGLLDTPMPHGGFRLMAMLFPRPWVGELPRVMKCYYRQATSRLPMGEKHYFPPRRAPSPADFVRPRPARLS